MVTVEFNCDREVHCPRSSISHGLVRKWESIKAVRLAWKSKPGRASSDIMSSGIQFSHCLQSKSLNEQEFQLSLTNNIVIFNHDNYLLSSLKFSWHVFVQDKWDANHIPDMGSKQCMCWSN